MSSAASILRAQIETVLQNRIPGALSMRSAIEPERIPTGIKELEERLVGIPRGCLTEICGLPSSGRTTLMLSLIRQVTQHGECCALIDTSSAFNPLSANANGINLMRLLCVQCTEPHPKLTPLEKALQATDWLIHAGGFGMIVLDLADLPPVTAQKIPMAWWYRFRNAVASTSAALVVLEQHPFAKTCASQVITMQAGDSDWIPTHGERQNPRLLTGFHFIADVTRSRVTLPYRKPQGRAGADFRIATSWAG
jgi:recombination protein RecA